MSTNKTTNLGLHSWVREDPFKMDEFNENFDKIDQAVGENTAALAEKATQAALAAETAARKAFEAGQLVFTTGEYTGKGESGASHPNRIDFDFKPLLVVVSAQSDARYGHIPWLRGDTAGNAFPSSTGNSNHLTWEERAIEWYSYNSYTSSQLNEKNAVYLYFALGIQE